MNNTRLSAGCSRERIDLVPKPIKHVRPRAPVSFLTALKPAIRTTSSRFRANAKNLFNKISALSWLSEQADPPLIVKSAKSAATSANRGDTACNLPDEKPDDPRFSSGPCRKHPDWSINQLDVSSLGCSHRSSIPKGRLASAITRSANLVGLPANWKLGIMPGSDTGAFEAAMWNLLGAKPVDALVWESFSSDWAADLTELGVKDVNVLKADYGQLPDLTRIDASHDLVFVYNGTTSGVRVPNLDWIPETRSGLVLCDATSAAFAMPLDFSRLDVVTWSWQKVLGGEAAHGMLALSPRAVERLESFTPPQPLPKVFRLTKKGKLIDGIFSGATINTPSMLAVEDLHSALDWAESLGGSKALEQRTMANFTVIDDWVRRTEWIDWLPAEAETRSSTSLCLKITAPEFSTLDEAQQREIVSSMNLALRERDVAWDIGSYRTAPPGFRLWGGPTIDSSEFEKLTPWLDWVFHQTLQQYHQTSTPEQETNNG